MDTIKDGTHRQKFQFNGKMCFLHNMEKLCGFSEVSMEKSGKANYQNGWYGDCMEPVWRVIFLRRFHVKISMEIFWNYMENMVNQIT